MAIAKLSIDLEARIASLQEGLARAERLNANAVQGMQAQWNKLDSVGANFAAGLKTAFAGLTLGAIGTQFVAIARGLDALNDAADATGASIENLSALEDIGARTGTNFDTITAAIVKFNLALKEADGKNGVSQALKAIGVSAQELKSLDPAEALRRTAVALAAYADDGSKARIVQELFGKSVREVAPLLKDLAAAGQLNATVTTAQAEQAERFNQQLSGLAKNSSDFARGITSEVLPALNRFLETWNKLGGVSGIFELNTNRLNAEATLKQIQSVTAMIERNSALIARSGGEANPSNAKAVEGLRLLRAEYDRLQTSLAETNEGLKTVADTVKPQAADGSDNRFARMRKSIGDLPEVAKKAKEQIDKLLDPTRFDVPFPGMQEALKRIADTDTVKLDRLKETLTALLRLDGQDPSRPGLAEAIAAVRGEQEKLTGVSAVAEAALKRLTTLLDAGDLAKLEQKQSDFIFLLDNLSRGQISNEQFTSAMRARFDLVNDAVDKQGDKLRDASKEWERFGENIQQGFGDTLTRAFSGQFDDIEQLWKQLLARMAAEYLSANLTGFISNFLKTSGVVGGALGSGSIGAGAAGASTVGMSQKAAGVTSRGGVNYTSNIVIQAVPGVTKADLTAATLKAQRTAQAEFLDKVARREIVLPSS